MNDFQYRLDETDQIIKNGHTLSRLYMENPTEPYKRFYSEDYDEHTNTLTGGYVETTDMLITDKLDPFKWPAWVANGSTAAGDSRIPVNTSIENSDILNVKIISNEPMNVINLTVHNSVLYADCTNSTYIIRNVDM